LAKVRWFAEWVAVRVAAFLLRNLPWAPRLWIGSGIGRLVHLVDRRHRAVAVENLRHAYPDADSGWYEATAREAFRHIGRLFSEIVTQDASNRDLLQRTVFEGWEHLQMVSEEGRGYFLVSAHFGNWERIALLQGLLGYPLCMVARPLDNPSLETFFRRLRRRSGNQVLYKRNAVREIVRGLRRGEGIAFMIDQNFGEPGRVFVPFFGRPAATTPVLGRVAVRMNVPVLPVFAYPLVGGRYKVAYGKPIRPRQTRYQERDALDVTLAVTRRVEEAVRSCPRAWFWMHRRWRTQPEEGDLVFGGPPHTPAVPGRKEAEA